MKKSILLLFTLCLLTQAKAQSTYYFCDFQGPSAPKNMSYYNLDVVAVKPEMAELGLGVYPWVLMRMNEEDPNKFMGSTSYFYEGGTANDWMITPPINLYSTGAKLSWRGIVPDNSPKRDSYNVLVSTKGTDVENFEIIYTVKEESSEDWVTHTVDLDKYAGKTVWIAFVNISTNKYVLGIDDIEVSGPEIPAEFTNITPRYTNEEKTAVKIKVTGNREEPLTAFTACYSVGGNTFKKEFTGLNLKKGESAEFEMDEKVSLEKGKSTDYKVWIQTGGKELSAWEYRLSRLLFETTQRVLIEDLTANWDGASILGMTAVDFLKEKYKEQIIPVGIHHSSFYDDPMQYTAYFKALNKYQHIDLVGLVNRKHRVTPLVKLDDTNYTTLVGKEGDYGYETALLKELEEGTYADINVTGKFTDKTSGAFKIQFRIEATFAIDIEDADYRLAATLIEKNVHKEYDTYAQKNYYSDYEGSVWTSQGMQPGMGGYENMESTIPPAQMTYQDVLRMSIGPAEGSEGTIPFTSIEAGKMAYSTTGEESLDFTDVVFPSPIHNADNVYMIAMVVNQKTGAIVNSNIVALGDPESAIFTSVKDQFNLAAFANRQGCEVLVTTDKPQTVSIELLNMEGKTVAMEKNYVEDNHTFTFNKRLPKGIYLVKGTAGEKVITQKIAF